MNTWRHSNTLLVHKCILLIGLNPKTNVNTKDYKTTEITCNRTYINILIFLNSGKNETFIFYIVKYRFKCVILLMQHFTFNTQLQIARTDLNIKLILEYMSLNIITILPLSLWKYIDSVIFCFYNVYNNLDCKITRTYAIYHNQYIAPESINTIFISSKMVRINIILHAKHKVVTLDSTLHRITNVMFFCVIDAKHFGGYKINKLYYIFYIYAIWNYRT